MSSCSENPYAGMRDEVFNPGEVRLYGRSQFNPPDGLGGEPDGTGQIAADGKKMRFRAGEGYIAMDMRQDAEAVSVGIIYGYAYEGHCYKLPKPRIMYLPVEHQPIVGGDSGCDCGYAPELGYVVWAVDKLDRVIVLDMRSDDVKTLLLEENMPGNRSPQAYAQAMAMAPQRGRE
ncbi:hypothetical protein QO002_004412 [Pararhizobium capsulatum DSM 1112]|uniref:LVIVD repeat-containing protein n=1 Tax=Pararhizobium capsulatum DSM 1112 TaxID=1121113 RepID=A0ABU0BX31_9HYPH|nr:hypothetical protein [Pararhizobium capsulatum DSM 1112]